MAENTGASRDRDVPRPRANVAEGVRRDAGNTERARRAAGEHVAENANDLRNLLQQLRDAFDKGRSEGVPDYTTKR